MILDNSRRIAYNMDVIDFFKRKEIERQLHAKEIEEANSKQIKKLREQLWECPINKPGCVRNCGNYGCGN